MRGALLVGIDKYPQHAQLNGCVNDATGLAAILSHHEDGTRNFEIELQTNVPTRGALLDMITRLFDAQLHTALFYFSGHGIMTGRGGYIVTPDFNRYSEGISMDEMLTIVNKSKITDKIVILDCCHSGAAGDPMMFNAAATYLAEGVVIMTAARKNEAAMEMNGHGIFTAHLQNALKGNAADLAGNITPGSIYGYIERNLGFMQQRPQFKANISRFVSLRNVEPLIPMEEVLRKITTYFKTPDEQFMLDPSYEFSNIEVAIPEKVEVFKKLQQMNRVGLVIPVQGPHMYFAAQHSEACKLTSLGKQYWHLVKQQKI